MVTKETLLAMHDFVVDNEYLSKYVYLIQQGLPVSKKQTFIHQIHHIIPRCYYRLNNLDLDNSLKNKVALSHANHVLAHYYLARCAANEELYIANLTAIHFIFSSPQWQLPDNEELLLKDIYKYDESMKIINESRSKNYTGTRYITKDNVEKRVSQDEIKFYLDSGWQFGRSTTTRNAISRGSVGKPGTMTGKHMSQEAKEKIGKHHSGGRYVHKFGTVKHISDDLLSEYIAAGWELGNPAANKKGSRCWVTSSTGQSKMISSNELSVYLSNGYTRGKK